MKRQGTQNFCVFFAFFFFGHIIWKNHSVFPNRSRKKLNTCDGKIRTKNELPAKQESPHYMFLNHASQQFSPQTLTVPTVILLVEYQNHPHLLAFAPTFSCTEDANTPVTDKYIHRYMIHPASFRMQLSPEGHSSELLFSSILLTPVPVWALCVPLTVMQFICGQRL